MTENFASQKINMSDTPCSIGCQITFKVIHQNFAQSNLDHSIPVWLNVKLSLFQKFYTKNFTKENIPRRQEKRQGGHGHSKSNGFLKQFRISLIGGQGARIH